MDTRLLTGQKRHSDEKESWIPLTCGLGGANKRATQFTTLPSLPSCAQPGGIGNNRISRLVSGDFGSRVGFSIRFSSSGYFADSKALVLQPDAVRYR